MTNEGNPLERQQESETNTMNRNLLIIGNGFDMANGLKSSFQQFFQSYLEELDRKLSSSREYNDDNFKISRDFGWGYLDTKNPSEYFQKCVNTNGCLLDWKNAFLEELFRTQSYDSSLGWADFEYAYFKLIERECRREEEKELIKQKIDNINKGLEMLTAQFCEYLKKEESRVNKLHLYNGELKWQINSINTSDALALNFNYTSIFDKYFVFHNHHHLHGSLKDEKNPPIIGFGDDYHINHKMFQDLNMNNIFRFSKSRHYLRNDSYRRISEWILNPQYYDVHIFGHSCGLTDRTLLKEIFKRKNCKNINIYYYETEDNYYETALNISRHFDNPAQYRLKVVPFGDSEACEQVNIQDRTDG